MEVKLFYILMVIQRLSSTAQELTVTPTSAVRDNSEVFHSTAADTPSSTMTSVLDDTPNVITAARCNVIDMDARDSNISNETVADDCNNTVDEEGKQTSSASPFDLIHSGRLPEATYNTFLAVYGYIEVPLSVMALVTNICSVIVFSRKRMKGPSSTILLALCTSEVLYIFFLVIGSIMGLIYGAERLTKRIYLIYAICFNVYVAVAVRRAVFCYTCLVSAERFIAVTFPLQAKSIRLVKHPGVVCALIMAVSFVAHIFSPLKFVVTSHLASDNTTTYGIQYSSMYVKHKVHFDNSGTVSTFIFVYFMLFGCLLFNLLIVISLRRHSKGRQSIMTSQNSEEEQKREIQTTTTIMASTFVFVILAMPSSTSSIVGIFNDDYAMYAKEHFLFMTMNEVGGLCELISSFTDFFFYIGLSTAFRETFLEVFIPCATRR